MNQNKQIPWGVMFHYAVVSCGIAPQDFWQMTMKEFSYLLGDLIDDNAAISRRQLEDMIKNIGRY